MATGKIFYWIKIRDSFLGSDAVDFLMAQKDGANYIVLYQCLCLMTMNTNGELARQMGEVLIPYDAAKIARDAKWFSVDTVRVALELYIKLGLVYEQKNGILKIADYDRIVGQETDWAEKKNRQRLANKGGDIVPRGGGDTSGDIVPSLNISILDNPCSFNPLEIRDKRLEIRDKRLEIRDNVMPSEVNSSVITDKPRYTSINPDDEPSGKAPLVEGFIEKLYEDKFLLHSIDDPEQYRYQEFFKKLLGKYSVSNINQSLKYATMFAKGKQIDDKYNWLYAAMINNCETFASGGRPDYDPSAGAAEMLAQAKAAGLVS